MPETIIVQNNFAAGELSPRLFGRTDLDKYRNGLKEQLNLVTQKHGGVIRRSGSRFVTEAKDSANSIDRKARVIEFQFSTQQTYILEFGNLYVRFYRDKGQLRHGTIYSVSSADHDLSTTATITTVSNHSLKVGDQVSIKGVLTDDPGFPIGFDGTFILTAVTSNTLSYTLAAVPPGTLPTGAGGTVTDTTGPLATEIATPYTEDQLRLLKWTQSADVLFLAHPDHEPRLLKRTSGADVDPAVWQLVELDPQDGPYLPVNIVATALIDFPGGVPGQLKTVTLTDPAVAEVNSGLGFVSTDVGRTISWQVGTLLHWAEITTFTDRKNVIVTLKTTPTLQPGVDAWSLGAWSDTDGWPFCVTLHGDRLWWGGSPALPQTVWGSFIGDFTNYEAVNPANPPEVTAENAVIFTISDDRVNTIHWLQSDSRGLLAFTNGGSFVLAETGGEGISAITPPTVRRNTTEPASQVSQPQRVGIVTLLVASADRKVLEFVFTIERQKFVAPDLSILAEHITLGGIIDTALQIEPDNIMWFVRADGLLLALTYERSEGVVAWSQHQIGGTLAGEPSAAVESVAVIRDGSDDLVWMVVKRTVNGSSHRYIEFLEPLFADDLPTEDAFFVDAGFTLDSSAASITGATQANPVVITSVAHGLTNGTRIRIRDVKGMTQLNDFTFLVAAATANTFELTDLAGADINGTAFDTYVSGGAIHREVQQVTGLEHLVGETVKILADGGTHPDRVVSAGGAVTLDRFASVIHVGLAQTYRAETLPLVASTAGETRGEIMRIDHATVRFNRSLGGDVGDLTKDAVVHRKPSDPMGTPPPLFSGRKKLSISARHQQDATVTLEGTDPLPMNMLSLEIKGGVEGL